MTMTDKPNDLLLLAGKIMTVLLMGLTGLATAVMLLLIPIILFNQAEFAVALTEAGGEDVGMVKAAAIVLLLIASVVAAFAFHFFQVLGRLINSVGAGDPFSLENANRLSRMGWIALGFQIASFPIAALVVFLGEYVPSENLTVDFDFSLTGLLLAIVLFILARVFKHGAAMREDLEGTV